MRPFRHIGQQQHFSSRCKIRSNYFFKLLYQFWTRLFALIVDCNASLLKIVKYLLIAQGFCINCPVSNRTIVRA